MNETGIRQGEQPGELVLSGALDYSTGAALRGAGKRLIQAAKAQTLTVDCAAVQYSTSVGLSLLLAWMRDAAAAGKQLQVRGLPQDMQQIAEVSGLLGLLPVVS